LLTEPFAFFPKQTAGELRERRMIQPFYGGREKMNAATLFLVFLTLKLIFGLAFLLWRYPRLRDYLPAWPGSPADEAGV
jgi:hypothetical protein